jgi:hypothetical protein
MTTRNPFRNLLRMLAALVLAVTMLLAGLAISAMQGSAQPNQHDAHANGHGHVVPPANRFLQQLALHDTMRKLWEEHVVWTRLFIVSDVAGLPDLSATTDRLLRNQVDLGNAFASFYGTAAGDQLTALLTQHILQAADILNAAKAGDQATVAAATTAWYANAQQIAAFLHNLNPEHWALADLQTMMREHLDLTLTEAVDQLTGNYVQSVADFDNVENEILAMGDKLSDGIIAQFAPHLDWRQLQVDLNSN